MKGLIQQDLNDLATANRNGYNKHSVNMDSSNDDGGIPMDDISTSENAIRELLRRRSREELLRRMNPERRALFESIITRRDRIGRIEGFDANEAIREIRRNG